ncbi:MAG: hypothetical protein EOO74_00255 [Myxococcales bacterium]|nr:MAG: hypothetical protein EOO74_00255 [Myxococcales bacterium]
MNFSDDNRLPNLSAADTRWLVKEVRQLFRKKGFGTTVINGVALRLEDGSVIGLENLACTVWRLPRRKWRREAQEQFDTLLAHRPTADTRFAPADLRPKLCPRGTFPYGPTYDVLEPLPGIDAILSAQGDGATSILGTLDQLDVDRDTAYDIALRNLASLPLPRHSRRLADNDLPNTPIEYFTSSDACTAARVMLLPELFRRILHRPIPDSGVLVAVPTKHDLWVHIPTDPMSLTETLTRLLGQSALTYSEGPYPISPDIFLVSPDMHARKLSTADPEGVDLHMGVLTDLIAALEAPEERAS